MYEELLPLWQDYCSFWYVPDQRPDILNIWLRRMKREEFAIKAQRAVGSPISFEWQEGGGCIIAGAILFDLIL